MKPTKKRRENEKNLTKRRPSTDSTNKNSWTKNSKKSKKKRGTKSEKWRKNRYRS